MGINRCIEGIFSDKNNGIGVSRKNYIWTNRAIIVPINKMREKRFTEEICSCRDGEW